MVRPSVTKFRFRNKISNVNSDQPEKMLKYCKKIIKIKKFGGGELYSFEFLINVVN